MDNQHFTSLLSPLLPKPPASLAVAVSGGADSMALALLLKDWCRKNNVRLIALTVDHALRAESKKEAKQVHGWLSSCSIEHHILTHKGKNPSANIMEQAREIRYGLLTGWCHKHKVKHLAIAHHRDDQAETFLMRLSRGSGADGLACMAPLSEMDGITLLRPLLGTPKSELVAYLEKKKTAWVEDPTNRRTEYTRNRLRLALEECFSMEERALLDSRLAATAAAMRRVKEALADYTAQAMEECVVYEKSDVKYQMSEKGKKPSDICYLRSDIWRTYPAEIRLRVLAEVLKTIGKAAKPLRFEKLERLHSMLLSNKKTSVTLAGCKVEASGDNCRIRPENTRAKP